MSGFLLRLAGPMQSWGEHSVYGERDTLAHPTRSGLVGMFAAAEGLDRGEPLDRYRPLRLTVRVDAEGVRMSDFHTVGGGLPRERTAPTAEGKRRPPGSTTIVTRRGYLSDAVFTVAVQGPEETAAAIAAALGSPRWQPYLGRRSFAPDQPLVLRAGVPDPVRELREGVPLPPRRRLAPASRWRLGTDTVSVDFVHEGDGTADGEGGADRSVAVLQDVPVSFASRGRAYTTRAVTRTRERLPLTLVADDHTDYRKRLHDYARSGRADLADQDRP